MLDDLISQQPPLPDNTVMNERSYILKHSWIVSSMTSEQFLRMCTQATDRPIQGPPLLILLVPALSVFQEPEVQVHHQSYHPHIHSQCHYMIK